MLFRSRGARPARVFWSVTLPLSVPGVLAGLVLGFARSIGEFGATITFVSNVPGETRTLPLAVYSALQRPDGDAEVFRLAMIAVALSLVALIASEALARRSGRGAHVLWRGRHAAAGRRAGRRRLRCGRRTERRRVWGGHGGDVGL